MTLLEKKEKKHEQLFSLPIHRRHASATLLNMLIIILLIALLYLLYQPVITPLSYPDMQKIRTPEQRIAELSLAKPILFEKRIETKHVDCGRVLSGDKEYISKLARFRPILQPISLDMGCQAVRQRVLPPTEKPTIPFGVAFARIVYTDYEIIEAEVRSSYHDKSTFCFSIDSKATPEFRFRVRQLAICLPNVIVASDDLDIDGAGHFMNHAHFSCLRLLNERPGWGYALLLQNHDVITKSPVEMTRIYSLMGGANDVEITPCPEDRWPANASREAESLKIFRTDSPATPIQRKASLHLAKGAVQASISREAVRWMVEDVDLSTLLETLNQQPFGVDEMFMESLQISDELEMPGRFTRNCLDQGHNTDFISRMSHWMYEAGLCATKEIRHAICVLGMEDVESIAGYPTIMVNKFIPSFDYAGLECVHEMLFNRTYLGQDDHPIEERYYEQMVNVRYHKARQIEPSSVKNWTHCQPPKDIVQWQNIPYPPK